MLFIKCSGSTQPRAINFYMGLDGEIRKSSPIKGHLNMALSSRHRRTRQTHSRHKEQGGKQIKQRKVIREFKILESKFGCYFLTGKSPGIAETIALKMMLKCINIEV